MCKIQAVVDADFTKHLCESGSEDLFERLMSALDRQPVMAWYVANTELFDCKKAQDLIKNGLIKVISPNDFLSDDVSRHLFDLNVRSLAETINEVAISDKADIYSDGFHLSGSNLGEIISELMAKELGIELFASNDKGAKRYAQSYINSQSYTLTVKNAGELFEEVAGQGKQDQFKWKEIKHLFSDDRWKQKRDSLRMYWDKK